MTFSLNPCQRIIDAEWERQIDDRGFVRINILKLRQGGITTYCTARGTHLVVRQPATALTLAHEQHLPSVWLRRCRSWRDQLPWTPHIWASQQSELAFNLPSRYYVGSAGQAFPGMGDCIDYLHLSEVGSWDKTGVSVDPDDVLADLSPALPTGDDRGGTIQIRESTGKMVGDWWHRAWTAAKSDDSEFVNIFLPWFLAPEYRRADLAGDILDLSEYERDLVRLAAVHGVSLTKAQLAWRRNTIRQDPWNGNVEEFACRYPASEDEAFLSPGLTIYTPEQQRLARQTERQPLGRCDVFEGTNPLEAEFVSNVSGEMLLYEEPQKHFHYVLGADVQWGRKDTADYDCLFVECLETGRLCAKLKGRYPLNVWGGKIAAVGYRYGTCPVAPERNAKAGNAVVALLLGGVADWRYPNVWVRSKENTIRPRVEDYGWWTDEHTKPQIIAYSQRATLDGTFDWADRQTIDQMQTIVRREDQTIGSPEGMHDDDWMARVITGYVAHVERGNLVVKPPDEPDMTAEQYKMAEKIKELDAMGDGAEEDADALVVG